MNKIGAKLGTVPRDYEYEDRLTTTFYILLSICILIKLHIFFLSDSYMPVLRLVLTVISRCVSIYAFTSLFIFHLQVLEETWKRILVGFLLALICTVISVLDVILYELYDSFYAFVSFRYYLRSVLDFDNIEFIPLHLAYFFLIFCTFLALIIVRCDEEKDFLRNRKIARPKTNRVLFLCGLIDSGRLDSEVLRTYCDNMSTSQADFNELREAVRSNHVKFYVYHTLLTRFSDYLDPIAKSIYLFDARRLLEAEGYVLKEELLEDELKPYAVNDSYESEPFELPDLDDDKPKKAKKRKKKKAPAKDTEAVLSDEKIDEKNNENEGKEENNEA